MSELITPDMNYPFSDMVITTPTPVQGGTYFCKLLLNDDPIVIQTPKCYTKNGIKQTEKKIYCDLLFDDTKEEFLNWYKKMEKRIQQLIFEKKDLWFYDPPSLEDIEFNWNTAVKYEKKNNFSIRSFINKKKKLNLPDLQIWDENENEKSMDHVKNDVKMVTIMEISGLRFSNSNFNLDVIVKQIVLFDSKPLFKKCLIKLKKHDENEDDAENEYTKNEDKESKPLVKVNFEQENDEKQETSYTTDEINENQEHREENDEHVEKSELDMQATSNLIDEESLEKNENLMEVDENKEIEVEVGENGDVEKNKEEEEGDILGIEENNEIKKEITETILKNTNTLENKLNEANIEIPNDKDYMELKKPHEVYLEIYGRVKRKMLESRRKAINDYLEYKNIKQKYMIEDNESSDDDFEFIDEDSEEDEYST